jgi:hypothetical protein
MDVDSDMALGARLLRSDVLDAVYSMATDGGWGGEVPDAGDSGDNSSEFEGDTSDEDSSRDGDNTEGDEDVDPQVLKDEVRFLIFVDAINTH